MNVADGRTYRIVELTVQCPTIAGNYTAVTKDGQTTKNADTFTIAP